MSKQQPVVAVHTAAMQLLRGQAVTISKSREQVRIQCEDADDADTLFSWLSSLTGNSVVFVGQRSGDFECFCWDYVPFEQWQEILGKAHVEDEVPGRLYPGDVLRKLGAEGGRFIFTVSAQQVP